jgi:hypothetical protein
MGRIVTQGRKQVNVSSILTEGHLHCEWNGAVGPLVTRFYSVWKVCNNIRNSWKRRSSSLVIHCCL